jgi:putative intracellular protease/amidase
MPAKKIIIPIPSRDFDPTEVAVSWKVLRDAGHNVNFATPDGERGHADPMMLSGEGLDPWGFIPLLRKLRLVGLTLRANRDARNAYQLLEQDPQFLKPLKHADVRASSFDGLLLPGGHAPGMRPYLESKLLQERVAEFFDSSKPVAAVCHGVVLAARSVSPKTRKSVLHGRKTTALTWKLEKSAWLLTKYFARFWDSGYYRTYMESSDQPPGYMSVQAEVTRVLAQTQDFVNVPRDHPDRGPKTSGLQRDSATNDQPAWVVRDRNYVSARWPGDVHTFAKTFARVLAEG